MTTAPSKPLTVPAGYISTDEMYTLDEVERRLGLGQSAMRTARRNGLTVRYVGRRGFVLGSDLVKYVVEQGSLGKEDGG